MPLDPMLADWKAAKVEFEKATGKKKPSDKFLGLFRKSSGIEDDLKAMDAIATKNIADDKQVKTLDKSLTSFRKTSASYQKMLKEAADKEPEKTTLYRGLKMLSARLDRYEASVALVVSEGPPDVSKGAPDAAKIIAATVDAAKRLAVPATKKGLILCASAIKALKMSPTQATWDKEMERAARGLTTGLRNYETIDKNFKGAAPHIKALSPYANGDLRTMKAGTTEDQVKAELVKFAGVVKAVAADFPDGAHPMN